MEGGELKEIILMKLSPLLQASIPPDYVANLVHDTLGQELINKINEMNLVLANHISDKVRFFNYFRLKQARKKVNFKASAPWSVSCLMRFLELRTDGRMYAPRALFYVSFRLRFVSCVFVFKVIYEK